MPRVKSDSTVTHRIEFSPKEREYVEQLVAGQTVKNVGVPVVIGVGVGGAIYIGYKSARAAYGWTQDIVDDIKATPLYQYGQAVNTTGGRILPAPLRGFYKVKTWLFG